MEQEYLPGTLRTRVLDLMKEHKVTQSDLALRIGMSESTLSRFLRSNSDKLSSEQVLQIARAFNVSTDFLLGNNTQNSSVVLNTDGLSDEQIHALLILIETMKA